MKNKKLYLFDLDGTLILGDQLIDGAKEKLEEIKKAGKKFIFFTNNSSRTKKEYIEKFKNMGIDIDENEIVTAGYTLGRYLQKEKKVSSVYVVGTESFKNILRDMGIEVVESPEKKNGKYLIDYVIVGLDSELNYEKIKIACKLLTQKDIGYLAANPDMAYPVEDGVFLPDCGSICKMLEYAVKRVPRYFGKPYKEILDYSLEIGGVSKDETVIVGDRLYTDIACGCNNGCDTILVLTGEASREEGEKSECRPTLILDSVKDIEI